MIGLYNEYIGVLTSLTNLVVTILLVVPVKSGINICFGMPLMFLFVMLLFYRIILLLGQEGLN